MKLFSNTILNNGSIINSCSGNFSNINEQQLIVNKGYSIELYHQDLFTNKLNIKLKEELFETIKCMKSFKILDHLLDLICLVLESGKFLILEYDNENNKFIKLYEEIFYESKYKRMIPNQYLDIDIFGRSIMISGVEKQKFLIPLKKENNEIKIWTPLKLPYTNTIIYDLSKLDNQYNNSEYATIEISYHNENNNKYDKYLNIYEYDINLNSVLKKLELEIEKDIQRIFYVPNDSNFPGGLILFGKSKIQYFNKNKIIKEVFLPKRYETKLENIEDDIGINNINIFKKNNYFFYLLQLDNSDIFKVHFEIKNKEVKDIIIGYFETLPIYNSLSIINNENLDFLFLSAEVGNHILYHFKTIDLKEDIIAKSKDKDINYYHPNILRNLIKIQELKNYSCIIDLKYENLDQEYKYYLLCSQKERSCFKILKKCLKVQPITRSELPYKTNKLFLLKKNYKDEKDSFIVLSLISNTIVLKINENIEGHNKNSLNLDSPTLNIRLWKDNSIIQICERGIRLLKNFKELYCENENDIFNWKRKDKINFAKLNSKQICLSVNNNNFIYLEINNFTLIEKGYKIFDHNITSIEIAEIPEGKEKMDYLAISFNDNSLKIFSLEYDNFLSIISVLNLNSNPCSLIFTNKYNYYLKKDEICLHLGLENGMYLRVFLESETGLIDYTIKKNFDNYPIKLTKIKYENKDIIFLFNNKNYFCFYDENNLYNYHLLLLEDYFEDVKDVQVDINSTNLIGIFNKSLLIFELENINENFSEENFELTNQTPRNILVNTENKCLVISTSTHRSLNSNTYKDYINELKSNYNKDIYDENSYKLTAKEGFWSSQIKIFDIENQKFTCNVNLNDNENIIKISINTFNEFKDEIFLFVGIVRNMKFNPSSFGECFIKTFVFTENGTQMELLHETIVESIPRSFANYKGKLLCGLGNNLTCFEFGKKILIKKIEYKLKFNGINNIYVWGSRIFITDIVDSIHMLRYDNKNQQLIELANDVLPRFVSSFNMLDYHTAILGDKFGNIFICRLPPNAEDEFSEEFITYKFKWENSNLNQVSTKFDQICNFHYGEIITSIVKFVQMKEKKEMILFSTTLGSIGSLFYFKNMEDIEFFSKLEFNLRNQKDYCLNTNNLFFRSKYGAVKNMIDGDYIQLYLKLNKDSQEEIATNLEMSSKDIIKKIEEIRNNIF